MEPNLTHEPSIWEGKPLPPRLSSLWNLDGLCVPEFMHGGDGFYRWVNTDQPDRYNASGNRYKPEDFGYALNSRGYRCDELGDLPKPPRHVSEAPRVLFIGCSHTFGVGLPNEKIWPRLTTDALEASLQRPLPYWNLAFGGRSQQWISRTLAVAIPALRPDVVVALLPPPFRFEVWQDGRDRPFSPNFHFGSALPSKIIDGLTEFFTPHQLLAEMIRNLALIRMTCRAYGAKLIWDIWERSSFTGDVSLPAFPSDVAECWRDFRFDYYLSPRGARDRLHPGTETHQQIADTVIPYIRNCLGNI